MRNKIVKTIVFILLVVLYGLLLWHKIELPAAEDIARHLKNGELLWRGNFEVLNKNLYAYTEPDFSFINHHWLTGVIFYLLYQATGWSGLVIFKVGIFLSAFALLFLVATKKANFWLAALFSIPAILILGDRTLIRPEMFSFLFTAVFLYLLTDLNDHPERKRIFWLIPIQILWVNMHLFFIIGPALVGGFLLEKIILNHKHRHGSQLVKKLAVLLLGLIAVCFINPHGVAGAIYPLQIFNNYGININENNSPVSFLRWRSPQENMPITVFFWAAGFLAGSFLFNLKKKGDSPLFYLLASTATIIGGLKMMRLLLFFSLIFLPAITANGQKGLDWLESFFKKRPVFPANLQKLLAVLLIGFLGYLIYGGSVNQFSNYKKFGVGLTTPSNGSAEFFKKQGLKGPIFNSFNIGSYLIYHLFPQEKVFVDNRAEAYSTSFLADTYKKITQEEEHWQKGLERYKFKAIFLYQYEPGLRPFIYRRLHDPAWSLVYTDAYAVILVRNSFDHAEVIKNLGITPENAEEKLQPLWQSDNYDDQVAAGDVFNLLDRADLGVKVLTRVIQKWPQKGNIWMLLGEIALKVNNNPQLAITYFEKAVAVGWKTPEAYNFLGGTYLKLGKYKRAEGALRKAVHINPDDQNSKELLEKFFNR